MRKDDHFEMRCVHGTYLTRSIVISGGKGAFEPMPLKCPGYEEFMHKGVEYAVKDPEAFRDKNVVVVGGGDTALDSKGWRGRWRSCTAVTVGARTQLRFTNSKELQQWAR